MIETHYADTIMLIERLHRRFLDLMRVELDRLGLDQINSVQSLLLANIGEDEVSVGELMSRGYYLGSNVTYNLKRLVATGLIEQERSSHDRRVIRVRLTSEGRRLQGEIARVLAGHAAALAEQGAPAPLHGLNEELHRLEAFWSEQIAGRGSRNLAGLRERGEEPAMARVGS